MDALYFSKIPIKRDITAQPLFFLALVAIIIGVQLFVTGFLAEMISMQSFSKRDYLVIEKVGLETPEKV
jgi:cobalamin synthase